MDDTRDLLVEIGTEELPPTALRSLSEAFQENLGAQLNQQRLKFIEIESFATPRRLALVVHGLASHQADRNIVRRGPAVKAAFDAQGQPTKAAVGFAKSCGVSVHELEREETVKGIWLIFRQLQYGQRTTDLVRDMVANALDELPIPKRMRWGDQLDEFVRPVHWVIMIFGDEPISGRLFGVEANRATRGHRFHHPAAIEVLTASDYASVLRKQGMVEPSFDVRRKMVREQVETLAVEAGGLPILNDALLDEVTALCEWPCAILGTFDADFLEVPSEVLIETMQKHQKYFAIVSANGELLPSFITISNIQSRDPTQVRAGNERVIRPRFSDAAFFWHQDLKRHLIDFGAKLDNVVFQDKLGSLGEKSARVANIARYVAQLSGKDEELAVRSARLGKCDLMTQMIFEFPSLQGTMGRYYAEKAGEHPCIVAAMEEQYFPRHAGDALPQSDCGLVLSIADRLDTLIGIFAIGQRPTGVKDPYGLRRTAIGLLRILIETPVPLDLQKMLEFSAMELQNKIDARSAVTHVFDYCMERLTGYYQDRNISKAVVDAVLAVEPKTPSDIHSRILAVESFRQLPEAETLSAANKRIRNILRKSTEALPTKIDASALREEPERRLAKRVKELESTTAYLLETKNYRRILKMLSELRTDVDLFFDHVMVMAEDSDLRRNRLGLVQAVQALFLQVADISLLKQSDA